MGIDDILLKVFGFNRIEQVKALRLGYVYGFITGIFLAIVIGMII